MAYGTLLAKLAYMHRLLLITATFYLCTFLKLAFLVTGLAFTMVFGGFYQVDFVERNKPPHHVSLLYSPC
jgi:hypothetical protein